MAEEKKVKIALIVGDPELMQFIAPILEGEDYRVKSYVDQQEAVHDMEEDSPDLIISEFQAPRINGLDFCKTLRKNFLFQYTPVIFILPDEAPLSKAKLFYVGADDYITRAKVEQELVIKIKMNLLRSGRERDIDPLTGLPGQTGLLKELDKRLAAKSVFAVFHADIFAFKFFNQRYGYPRGDEVIKFTATVILSALKNLGTSADFLSHPYSDDFIFLSSPDAIDPICERVIKNFNAEVPNFYDETDRAKGYIAVKNRKGEVLRIPFLKIHIGAATNEYYPFLNTAQIMQICSELKDFAQKNSDKSLFVKERRKRYPFS